MNIRLALVTFLFKNGIVAQNSSDIENQMKERAVSFISQMALNEKIDQLMNAALGNRSDELNVSNSKLNFKL